MADILQTRDFALSLRGSTEGFPFGDGVLVFKVMGKMFAFSDLSKEEHIVLKCDPEVSPSLIERFDAVEPGFNKKHWIKVFLNRDLLFSEIKQLILHSYAAVILKQPRSRRNLYPELSDVAYVPIIF